MNQAPRAAGTIPEQVVEVDSAVAVDVAAYFTDPDGDTLTYSAVSSSVANVSVTVSGSTVTLTGVAAGSAVVTVTARDPEGLTAEQAFPVTVPNRAPVAVGAIEDLDVFVDSVAEVDVAGYFTDPDGDELAYRAVSSDTTLAVVAVAGSVVTATGVAVGSVTVTVTAQDTAGLSAEQGFGVTVPNRAPQAVGTIADREVEVDSVTVVDVAEYFTDPDRQELEYSVAASDTTRVAVAVAGSEVTVAGMAKGGAAVTVTASDPGGLTAGQSFVVTVPNRPPHAVGAVAQQDVYVGDSVGIDVVTHFSDPDGDTLAYSAASSDTTLAAVSVSGGTVTLAGVAVGSVTVTVTITAEDSEGLDATQQFGVRIDGDGSGGSDPNQPPEVVGDIHEQKLEEGDRRRVDASSYFSDPDDDALEFSAESSDTEVVRATTSGSEIELEVVTTGTATVTVTAQDAEGLAASTAFGVAVEEPTQGNRAPVTLGTIADKTFEEDESSTLNASTYFTDPDGDDLTYSAESSDVEVLTATASGSVISLQATGHGTATVAVSAEDPAGLDVELNFTVTVAKSETPNRPPAAGPIPAQSMKVGITRTLDASTYFGDPDLDELTFSAESSDTDVLTATVTGNDLALVAVAEGSATVTVTAEDPDGLSASTEFQATVAPAPDENKPPYVAYEMEPMTFLKGEGSGDLPWFYIKDPDDDFADLDYAVSSSDNSVFRVVRVNPDDHRPRFRGFYVRAKNKEGQATITLTVTDPGGLSANTSVVHTVGNNPPYTKYTPADTVSRAEGEDHVFFLLPFLFFRDVGLFADDDIGDSMTFTVATSDESVATAIIGDDLLAPYVKVTAVSLGDATITVTFMFSWNVT